MNLPLLIARRMARKGGRRPGMMERIAVLSVAVSLAVMIVALAVVMGFKREVTRKLTAFTAHVTVADLRSADAAESYPIERSPRTEALIRETDGFERLAPYAVRGGVVRTDDAVEGVLLKGVDTAYDWSAFRGWLVEGAVPRVADSLRTKEVLVSDALARRLRARTGDGIEMLFIEPDARPRRDRFRISGIYASGMEEMDRVTVVTDLRNVQRLSGWDSMRISGYEITLDDVASADAYAQALDRALFLDDSDATINLAARSVGERYPGIFDWLRAHDVNAAVIVGIMLVVAFFNMATALMILVLERMQTIGLLKALGMTDGMLRRVFLYRAAFVALKGLAWGNAAGLALCFAQLHFHLVKLDSEGYLLSEVPVSLGWGWWLALNAGFLAAIVLLLVAPAHIVTTVKPDRTIRYE